MMSNYYFFIVGSAKNLIGYIV